jgi:peptide/nickel transport system permease protein
MSAPTTRRAPFVRVLLSSPQGRIGTAGLAVLVLLAVVAPPIWEHTAAATNLPLAGAGPSSAHPFGTDGLGRDLMARTFAATRLSLELAVLAAAISATGGTALGLLVASAGRARGVGARVVDALLGIPDLLIAIYVVAIFGAGATLAAVAVGIAGIPFFARVTLTLASSVAGREHVLAARALGVSRTRVLFRHVLPSVAETLVVSAATGVTYALIAVSSLSFLGLGVQAPDYDWGALLTQGIQTLYVTPVAALAPGAMIALTGLLLGLFADALAQALNPRLWTAAGGATGTRLAGRGLASLRGRARARESVAPAARTAAAPAAADPAADALVSVRGLTISFPGRDGRPVAAVAGVDLDVARGEIVGVVGESGSGKSLTALALGRLEPHPARLEAERLRVAGADVLGLSAAAADRHYRDTLAYVFQDPSSSLNPALRVERQLTEALPAGGRRGQREAAVAGLREVGISAPEHRVRQYPHELSGGMRQRVMIAMGLLARPQLIVADEPTTALDVTVQAQVIALLRDLNRTHGTAVLLISHSLGVVSQICSRVVVMYAGRVVEDGPVGELLTRPRHPYTRALIAAVPMLTTDVTAPLAAIDGQPPAPGEVSTGCPFAPRCAFAQERCREQLPPLDAGPSSTSGDADAQRHRAACWLSTEEMER